MKRHLMLLFLSDVKTRPVDPKNPKGRREVASLAYRGGIGVTMTTNESAVRFLLLDGWNGEAVERLDRLFVFASKFVRNGVVAADDVPETEGTDGKRRKLTHLEYFQERLRCADICDRLAGCMDDDAICFFDEDAPISRAMEMTAKFALHIQEYLGQHTEDEFVLHVDCTGGLRHANMMMLNIMRLMQYQRITIGRVLYSKYVRAQDRAQDYGIVEDATEIYRMMDLIAGAEEFVQFGSISVLKKYFAHRPQSPELQALLSAMNKFAEEIKLCHKTQFEEAILELHGALQKFQAVRKNGQGNVSEASRSHRLDDQLMLQIEQRIWKDYEPLFSEKRTDMSSVRWCIEHDYLQQALTLYIETFPGYLFESGILRMEEELRDEISEKGIYTQEFYFLNHFFKNYTGWRGEAAKAAAAKAKEWNQVIRSFRALFREELLKKIAKGKIDGVQGVQDVRDWLHKNPGFCLENEGRMQERLSRLASLRACPEDLVHEERLEEWLRDLLEECRANFAEEASFPTEAAARYRAVLSYLRKNPSSQNKKQGIVEQYFTALEQNFAYPLECFLKEEPPRLTCAVSMQELRDIVNAYMLLKKERNTENHAKEEKGPFDSAAELKAYMARTVQLLECMGRNCCGKNGQGDLV